MNIIFTEKVKERKLTNLEQEWINDNSLLLSKLYPKVDKKFINDKLLEILNKNIKSTNLILKDTYRGKTFTTDTLKFPEYCNKSKPTLGGNGVLFDRNRKNPAIKMLDKFAARRKDYKDQMYKCDANSYEFDKYDLYQKNEKVKLNAWYGINGAMASLFYNLECATAITGKGRHLISIATCAFDRFLGSYMIFLDFNDCMIFIKNIINEDKNFKDEDYLDSNVSVNDVYNKLYEMFENPKDCNESVLKNILKNLSNEELNRIYYKNNIEKFCLNKKPKELLNDIVNTVDVYVNPAEDKTPEELKVKLDSFWEVLKEFVLYDYPIIDKTYRVVFKKRKCVLVIDTDSNMIHLDPWIEFVKNNIVDKDTLKSKNENDFNHVIIYTMCYLLSKMIRQVLKTYLRHCNVKEEKIPLLDMKNEYLFSKMLITRVKKNYASIIEYKEGKFMDYKLDIKGLPIHKSSTNRIASKRFTEILENSILKADKVNLIDIMMQLYNFQNEIKDSLISGELKFLKPVNVKVPEAYADPLIIGGYRGAMVWNLLNPMNEIELPDSFFLLKMTLTKREQLEQIEDEEVREILDKNIFQNPEKRIASKGVYLLGIPKDASIPKWAIPFIDVDTIIEDTMKAFMGVIKALGIKTVQKNSQSEQFSNYISI